MKLNKIAALLAVAGMSAPAFATNGDNLIGLGVQSRALGGTGTAAYYGAENALTNPALLGKLKGTEFSFAATAFMPDVKATTNVATFPASASDTSDSDLFGIPEVSLAHRIDNNWVVGIGMFGTSGMGVDFRGNPGLFEGYSSLQMMKFVPSVSYNGGNFGLGAGLAFQYGALDINYVTPAGNVGSGTSTDFGTGINLGGYYDFDKNLTLGVAYQSQINMTYDEQLTVAADGFGIGPNGMGTITSNKLSQPAEFKLGVAYTMGEWMLTADYKRIYWGSADGYETFNWEDQDVFGLGVKYSANGWWLGGGYNYGSDPIKKLGDSTNPMVAYSNQAINVFNNHFFPGITEGHFTFGGGMAMGKTSTLEFAVVYAPEVTKTVDTGYITGAFAGMPLPGNMTTHTVDHSQLGITGSIRMNF
jgi:long-chain fatty acid transport protein